MVNNLHQLLRSLCFNTQWNYAIFWKLKHCAPMYVITTIFTPFLCASHVLNLLTEAR